MTRLLTSIPVIHANDIILTQITARLYLNQFKQRLSGIFKAVKCSQWNIGGLVFAERNGSLFHRNQGTTPDHNPVFGPVMMFFLLLIPYILVRKWLGITELFYPRDAGESLLGF